MISMILAAGALIWMCHPISLMRFESGSIISGVGATRADRDQRGRGDLQHFTTVPERAHHILLAAAAAERAPRAYHGGAKHRPSNIRAGAFRNVEDAQPITYGSPPIRAEQA